MLLQGRKRSFTDCMKPNAETETTNGDNIHKLVVSEESTKSKTKRKLDLTDDDENDEEEPSHFRLNYNRANGNCKIINKEEWRMDAAAALVKLAADNWNTLTKTLCTKSPSTVSKKPIIMFDSSSKKMGFSFSYIADGNVGNNETQLLVKCMGILAPSHDFSNYFIPMESLFQRIINRVGHHKKTDHNNKFVVDESNEVLESVVKTNKLALKTSFEKGMLSDKLYHPMLVEYDNKIGVIFPMHYFGFSITSSMEWLFVPVNCLIQTQELKGCLLLSRCRVKYFYPKLQLNIDNRTKSDLDSLSSASLCTGVFDNRTTFQDSVVYAALTKLAYKCHEAVLLK